MRDVVTKLLVSHWLGTNLESTLDHVISPIFFIGHWYSHAQHLRQANLQPLWLCKDNVKQSVIYAVRAVWSITYAVGDMVQGERERDLRLVHIKPATAASQLTTDHLKVIDMSMTTQSSCLCWAPGWPGAQFRKSEPALSSQINTPGRKQGKSEGFDSCDRLNPNQIGFKSSINQPVWPWNLMNDLEK